MSDELTSALRGFAEAQRRVAESAATDPDLESRGLVRRVRRRRAVRTGSGVLGATVVVGAVAAGILLSAGRAPAPPAVPVVTSTPTSTPSPTTTTPAPSSTTTTTPAAPAVATLREAPPMAPGMLDAAGAGWSLIAYSAHDEQQNALIADSTYLLSPDGRPFVVPTAPGLDGWKLGDWLPRSSLVLAYAPDSSVHVVDLLTGETGPTVGYGLTVGPAYEISAQFVGDGSTDVLVTGSTSSGVSLRRVGADGVVRSRVAPFEAPYGTAIWVQSPDRSRVVLNDSAGPRVVAAGDLAELALAAPYPDRPGACRAWAWVDDAELLLECTPSGGTDFDLSSTDDELWLVPVDSGGPRQLAGMPIPERLGGVWRVGGTLVAGMFGPSESEASWWEVTDTGVVPLSSGGPTELDVYGVRGSELLARSRPYAAPGVPATSSVVTIDPVAGTTRTVVSGEPAWFTGLTVVPRRFAAPPQSSYGD